MAALFCLCAVMQMASDRMHQLVSRVGLRLSATEAALACSVLWSAAAGSHKQ